MKYDLFVDLDGVLADFNRGIIELMGDHPDNIPDSHMWPAVARKGDFFETLPWMVDGQELWDYIKTHNPSILTGVPRGKFAGTDKRVWVGRELGHHVKVDTCWSKEKYTYCYGPECILIDDRKTVGTPWAESGGIFIHHVNATDTIDQLYELGI